ncbi:MAG: GatB/YqeY domain-containing protein [Candidatus Neomarinimicrobiota bacterium]|tara:strand:+ start:705 stop:1148 length:444 start_codon:yes stop_codon:yes gene_type:complete
MNYIEKIKQDMYAAMKAKKKVEATILRSFLSNLKKIEIEKKDSLTDNEYLSTVKKMVKQLKESIDAYSQAGRNELAEKEKSELSIMQAYLPKQFSEKEISELIKNTISEISAKNISDLGKVMTLVMKKGGGKVDGGIANRITKELLQ